MYFRIFVPISYLASSCFIMCFFLQFLASKGSHLVGRLLVIILEGNNLVCSKDGKVKVVTIVTDCVPAFDMLLDCMTLEPESNPGNM